MVDREEAVVASALFEDLDATRCRYVVLYHRESERTCSTTTKIYNRFYLFKCVDFVHNGDWESKSAGREAR